MSLVSKTALATSYCLTPAASSSAASRWVSGTVDWYWKRPVSITTVRFARWNAPARLPRRSSEPVSKQTNTSGESGTSRGGVRRSTPGRKRYCAATSNGSEKLTTAARPALTSAPCSASAEPSASPSGCRWQEITSPFASLIAVVAACQSRGAIVVGAEHRVEPRRPVQVGSDLDVSHRHQARLALLDLLVLQPFADQPPDRLGQAERTGIARVGHGYASSGPNIDTSLDSSSTPGLRSTSRSAVTSTLRA